MGFFDLITRWTNAGDHTELVEEEQDFYDWLGLYEILTILSSGRATETQSLPV